MKKWLEKWYEIGWECNWVGEPVPFRSIIAWHILHKNWRFWAR